MLSEQPISTCLLTHVHMVAPGMMSWASPDVHPILDSKHLKHTPHHFCKTPNSPSLKKKIISKISQDRNGPQGDSASEKPLKASGLAAQSLTYL